MRLLVFIGDVTGRLLHIEIIAQHARQGPCERATTWSRRCRKVVILNAVNTHRGEPGRRTYVGIPDGSVGDGYQKRGRKPERRTDFMNDPAVTHGGSRHWRDWQPRNRFASYLRKSSTLSSRHIQPKS